MGYEDKRVIKSRYTADGVWIRGHVEVLCCGTWIWCDGMATTCDVCGADYNWNGSQLAPRVLWDGTDGAGSPGYE